MEEHLAKTEFLKTRQVSHKILTANMILAAIYFVLLAFFFPRGNTFLFILLVVGQIYYIWQIATYAHTVWNIRHESKFDEKHKPPIDIFITVCGEPIEIIAETIKAAKNMDYESFRVYILNDGFVAKKDNWKEVEALAEELQVACITRDIAGGAKAGNINNALKRTYSPLFVVFDADHVPHRDFLKKTVGYFIDPAMAFVQTPQYYKNNDLNYVTGGAWEQQELFFGAICKGKDRLNSAFMCGTNMVVKRAAIEEVGGMNETNITEDLLTSQFIHEKGWKSVYVPKVLSEGLAPEDFSSYHKQQYRWSRGSLELIFKYNALFRKGLNLNQKIQYLASASFYLSGLFVLINALFPVIFFFTGHSPFEISTPAMAAAFLPYIFLTVYILMVSSNFSYTYKAVAFSMGAFPIHIKALISTLLGKREAFQVTSKKGLSGNFLYLAIPHMAYIILVASGVGYAFMREGLNTSFATNLSWAILNVAIFVPFIIAALPASSVSKRSEKEQREPALMD